MTRYRCEICEMFEYDSDEGAMKMDIPPGTLPEAFPTGWVCPVCDSDNTHLKPIASCENGASPAPWTTESEAEYLHHIKTIQQMAETGKSVPEPMRTALPVVSWDDILVLGAQLARQPLNPDEEVSLKTTIGPNAAIPLVINTPVTVSHMSFGALGKEVKTALAKGSAAVKIACSSGEGGILPEEKAAAYRYIFEYVPNQYSVTDENLRTSDAIEIKIGQSAKAGLGGLLPADKVAPDIAAIRNVPPGSDVESPARFPGISGPDDLKNLVYSLRERSGGRPIGIKIAAGDVEGDMAVAIAAVPDFITVDGRPGGTGAAPKIIKDALSVPTIYAINRARKVLDDQTGGEISLIATGGFRTSADIVKALAMGADAVALGTACLMALGCDQFRICHTGMCPRGITTHNPTLCSRFDTDSEAGRLTNFLVALIDELEHFARLTGHADIHELSVMDLCTTNREIAEYTRVPHA